MCLNLGVVRTVIHLKVNEAEHSLYYFHVRVIYKIILFVISGNYNCPAANNALKFLPRSEFSDAFVLLCVHILTFCDNDHFNTVPIYKLVV